MMNRPMLKRVFPQALAWTALAVLSGAMALAQDAAPVPVPAAAEAPTPAAATPETSAPAAATRTDGEIEQDVVHALDASKALKSDLITAATIQGEVTLSGTVSSEASGELAEAIAAHVEGVTKVNNNLEVGNPQAPAKPDAQPMANNQPGDAGVPNPGDAGAPAIFRPRFRPKERRSNRRPKLRLPWLREHSCSCGPMSR